MGENTAMKMAEIAARIDAHLKRFEADPVINAERRIGKTTLAPYYRPGAGASGRFVYVGYVAYQGQSHLTKSEAERYLAALDAGFVGKHFRLPTNGGAGAV